MGEYESLDRGRLSGPRRALGCLEDAVDDLRGSNAAWIVDAALRKSARRIPGQAPCFCILQMGISDGFGVQGAAGVSAFTAGSGKLLLVLNLEGTRSEW